MTEPLSAREAARVLRWAVGDLARMLEDVDPEAVPADAARELAHRWPDLDARVRRIVACHGAVA